MQMKIMDGVTPPANFNEILSAIREKADDTHSDRKNIDLAIMSPDGPLYCAIRLIGIHPYMAAGEVLESFGYRDTNEPLHVQGVRFDSVSRLA